jgi:ribonucleotide reductase alpha subunit
MSDNTDLDMYVIKRNDLREKLSYKKILERTRKVGNKFENNINYTELVMKVMDQLHNDIKTSEIDELMCQLCASLCSTDYDYYTLASYLAISNHQKQTSTSFVDNYTLIFNDDSGYLSTEFMNIIIKHKDFFESILDYERDYLIDYFGFKTLERAYLMKHDNIIQERIQHLWLRVAIQIHKEDLDKVKETYDGLSQKYFIHATPTLFNSGTKRPQLSSCYLLAMEEDSIDGIFNTLHDCANISKWAGGIGLHIHNIRAKNTKIVGTNGTSNGLVPMLRVFNNTARYVDQGGGKRSGSFAMYLEPWHSDIEDFLELRKNHGDEEMRARDLFYALWISDLFMKQVENDDYWHLMCPNQCPGLSDCYGDEFEALYFKYVNEGKYSKKMKARELWFQILDSQMETGTPYMLYKDSANKKSNQRNLGTIKSSNLCCEIMEYSNKNETAVCNLASISLSTMVDDSKRQFNFEKLGEITEIVTENLNKIIDVNFYPTQKTYNSNMNHRPIGIGVQGLADCFAKLGFSFDSNEAQELNKQIFETIYFHTMKKSNELSMIRKDKMKILKDAFVKDLFRSNVGFMTFCNMREHMMKNYYTETFHHKNSEIHELYHEVRPTMQEIFGKTGYDILIKNMSQDINLHDIESSITTYIREDNHGGAYSSFEGSPCSQGLLQFDLWNVTPSNRYDWVTLKASIMKYGLRNSLCVAPMPTASTSQILANNECFEPFTSNIYSRRTLAGEFVIINKYLMKELKDQGLWNKNMKNMIIENKGSIQNIQEIPKEIRERYKIVWDMSMKRLIDMAKDRGAYICQSQSMNLWVEDPNYKNLTSMHFYAWKSGLKTGIYYLRRKAKHQAQQFTIEPKKNMESNSVENDTEEECLMCGA